MRHDLRYHVVQNPRRWNGVLARMTRARALMQSNSIEGINVSQEDAIAAVDGEDPVDADRPTWRAVVGYQAAMDYILQRTRDENFAFSKDVILAVHFMISQHDLDANPGNLRRGWVGVRNSQSGLVVHEGVDRELLDPLLGELIGYMNADSGVPAELKGTMTHLNLTMLHPFADGNGRAARCLQTAVLARQGIVAPEFSSIEEYIGRHQQEYYDVLAQVGGGKWQPQRDARPWVRFCLTGHYRQAQIILRRVGEVASVYDELVKVVARSRLPERAAVGLIEATFGRRTRNASYRVTTEVNNNLASRDLKELVDAGLLMAVGEKRGRHYVATRELRAIREKHRLPRKEDDPFAEDPTIQASLPL